MRERTMPEHVELRAITEADLPVFFEHQRDPAAAQMAAFPPRERDAFMTHWQKILADDGVVVRSVIVDGAVAGNIVCYEQSGRRLVGYWIGQAFWGRGIASRALSALVKEVTHRPLYAYVAQHNAASIRVLEKCDFERVGACVDEGAVPEFLYALHPNAPDTVTSV